MGLSFGGGFGPVRGRIGTRGIGVGVGPFSASTGFRRGRGGDAAALMMLQAAALMLLLIWPWVLGAWVAEKFGASDPSTARTVVAWTFEACYLLPVTLFVLVYVYDRFIEPHRWRKPFQTQIRNALREYDMDVRNAGYAARPSGDTTRLPLAQAIAFKGIDSKVLFAQEPIKSAVRCSLGVWFGLYRRLGRFVIITERAGNVQRFISCDTVRESKVAWGEIETFCAERFAESPAENERTLNEISIKPVATIPDVAATHVEGSRLCLGCGKPGMISRVAPHDKARRCR